MSRLTIVLADDHQLVRNGLRILLEADMGALIVGEAADGPSALQLAERLQPDVLIADIIMPGLTGLEIARRLRHRAPHTRMVMLSMHANEAYVREALRAGAIAYVL